MAITIGTEIQGQQATPTTTYCYLYEPLRIVVNETDLTATKLYVDIEIYRTDLSTTLVDTLVLYAEFDINSGDPVSFDLMKIVRQYHDSDLIKFSKKDDFALVGSAGQYAGVSRYIYHFKIYSDKTATPVIVRKLPIIGGRAFEQFTPIVDQNIPVNEFEYYGISTSPYKFSRWGGIFSLDLQLKVPTLLNAAPSIVATLPSALIVPPPCGGFLLWKSRFGGWMWWGFDIQQREFSKSYEGNLENGMFESTTGLNGDPFVPVDYVGIKTSYTRTLKALGLTNEELLAVAGINASPAVWYLEPNYNDTENPTYKIELMRVTSASAPYDTKANGGDFTVRLQSISVTEHTTK